ncbi:MAG TPA: hypothetical protein VD864_04225 [Nocardioides sp.]|nr:hypothetical protein [Nocardioides sp.]
MTKLDYEALGFTLTPEEAARRMDTTPGQLRDLIRNNELHFLVVASGDPLRPLTIRIHRDEPQAYLDRKQRELDTVDDRNRLRVTEALRRYLAEVPAVENYDDAVELGAPLLASTREGEAVHISPAALSDFCARTRKGSEAVLTITSIEGALPALRALRKRGVIPADSRGGKQRWGVWWRIPSSLLPGGTDDQMVDDMLNGVADGERLSRRGTGVPFLPGVLGADE